MDFKLYNTASRAIDVIEPIGAHEIKIYTCGPTVYHHAHVGNMRTYISTDVLVRALILNGYAVKHVMNITDVGHLTSDADEGEDKMDLGAAREGLSAWDVADRYAASFFAQCASLRIHKPQIVCRATDHIAQQLAMITALHDKGYAYRTDDGIYFDTGRMPSYGAFAKLDLDGLRGGARVDLGQKRSKTDFALWKFSQPGPSRQMEWPSPWGLGFPGWHIECSAMANFYLGDQIDIHTGGIDHIPVHHTNEIAQSECATGATPFARHWMHSNFLMMNSDERMAKSSGSFLTVFALQEAGFNPLAFRLLCLKAHYRTLMTFSWSSLKAAATQYRRLKEEVASLALHAGDAPDTDSVAADRYDEQMRKSLFNDLSTPASLTTMQRALADPALSPASKLELVRRFDTVFGLELTEPGEPDAHPLASAAVVALIEERQSARARRDWAAADQIRDQIKALGYIVEDTPDGPRAQPALVRVGSLFS